VIIETLWREMARIANPSYKSTEPGWVGKQQGLLAYNNRMSFYESLVYARRNRWFGRLAYFLLKLLGAEIPPSVEIGPGFLLHHGGVGVVIHPKTVIGARVGIYPGVTLGRADVHKPASQSAFEGIRVEDDVILGAGSKVLCERGVLRIGRGSVLGANAVLLESTGEDEIWAGIPARRVGRRDD
jgi:serine O-acetyltransferase